MPRRQLRPRRTLSPDSSSTNPLSKKPKSQTEVAQTTSRRVVARGNKSDQDEMSDDEMNLKNEVSRQKQRTLRGKKDIDEEEEEPVVEKKKKEPRVLTLESIEEMVTLFGYPRDELMVQYEAQQKAIQEKEAQALAALEAEKVVALKAEAVPAVMEIVDENPVVVKEERPQSIENASRNVELSKTSEPVKTENPAMLSEKELL